MSTTGSKLQQDITTGVETEFQDQQAAFLQEVKMWISDALKNNQRIILITDTQKEEKKSRAWDIAQILVPVVLTGLVGLGVWYMQNTLSDKITAANNAVSTRYVLTQEYYKARFSVYQRIYERLSDLEGKFLVVQQHRNEKQAAIDAKDNLDKELGQSELYFSPNVFERLKAISLAASQVPTVNPDGNGKLGDLRTQITAIKNEMYVEVSGEIGQLPTR